MSNIGSRGDFAEKEESVTEKELPSRRLVEDRPLQRDQELDNLR